LLDDRALNLDAVRGLAAYDHPDTPKHLVQRLPKYSAELRAAAIDTLVSRPGYAKALLHAIETSVVQPKEISALQARQIYGFGDDELTRQFASHWGEIRATNEEKRTLIARYKSDLPPEQLARADLSQGRQLFQKTCANCHVLYGQGQKIGPDLTGSNRKNLDYLLENVVDPSAVVGADFRATTFILEDGRVLNGVLAEQSDRTITVQTAQERITLDRSEIDDTKPTTNSLMPDGLLQNLDAAEVRNLIAYLMSTDQVQLPTHAGSQ
jgi:putative heme-binding domain-containing protein